jgi:Zn-dependent peptidase ImmA (M78 family)
MKIFEALTNNKFELIVDEELRYDNNKLSTTKQFLNFCIDDLGLQEKFYCYIVSDRQKHGIKTTAYYLDDGKVVKVYGKGRMLGDVLRSIAHELVHQLQHEEERVEYPVQDVGGEIEDEANAKAGSIVKKFIKTHPGGKNLFESNIR